MDIGGEVFVGRAFVTPFKVIIGPSMVNFEHDYFQSLACRTLLLTCELLGNWLLMLLPFLAVCNSEFALLPCFGIKRTRRYDADPRPAGHAGKAAW
jgi:hypothetical protein